MSLLIIFNISFALVFHGMFLSDYHKKDPYLLNLFLFLINAAVTFYNLFHYFGMF